MPTPNSPNEKESTQPQQPAAGETTPQNTAGTAGGNAQQPQQTPLQKAADEIIKESGEAVPTPTAPPPAPQAQPAPEKTIDTTSPQRSVPPPQPPQTPAPQTQQPAQPPVQKRSAIRTYESDVAQTVRGNKVSLAGIAIAERRKRPKRQTEEKPRSFVKTLLISLGIVLVLVGAGAIAVVFFYEGDDEIASVPQRESLIFANETVELNIDGLSRNQLINTIESLADRASGTVGSVTEIVPMTEDDETEEVRPLTAGEFITRLNTRAPARLLRSVRDTFMLGVHIFDDNEPFLILKTTFFDTTFAGMLEWEEDLAADIPFLVGKIEIVEAPEMPAGVATSTATTTPATENDDTATSTDETATTTPPAQEGPIPVAFGDIVVDNRDARILVDADGNEYLVYSFPDTTTLVITTNRRTLSEIFDRLTTARFTQ